MHSIYTNYIYIKYTNHRIKLYGTSKKEGKKKTNFIIFFKLIETKYRD